MRMVRARGAGRGIRRVVAALLAVGALWPASVRAAEPVYQKLARDLVGADQGVLVRAEDGTVLASIAADRAVHPASVSKIPATLALLERLGPSHRFRTRVLAAGPVEEGALRGDLLVEAGGDPFLVSENALLILAALDCLGVEEVAGTVRVVGEEELVFNWAPDAQGRTLAQDLRGTGPPAAWLAVADAQPHLVDRGPGSLGLRIRSQAVARADRPRPLLEHRSPPLLRILKELNGFSNNIFHPLARQIGGSSEVERRTRARVAGELRAEIVIDNAAGAGKTNRLSPRATVAVIDALAAELARHDLDLADVLPLAGVDTGTLSGRFRAQDLRGVVVGKTGTYGSLGASALAGVARTREHGLITFAILNRGVAVPEARRRQDAFLSELLRRSGPVRWEHERILTPPFAEAEVVALADARCSLPRQQAALAPAASHP